VRAIARLTKRLGLGRHHERERENSNAAGIDERDDVTMARNLT